MHQAELKKINIRINLDKTKAMLMSTAIKATRIKAVKSYSYLGAIIEENGKIEVHHNIGKVVNYITL